MSISRRTILSGIAASGLLAPVVASAAGADPAPAQAPAIKFLKPTILQVIFIPKSAIPGKF